MASTERHLTACFDVPHANTVVARTAREPAIGKKHEIGDRSFMAVEDSDGDSVVELPDPDRAVIPTAGQRVAIRKYRDGVNTTLMPGQCKAPGTVAVVNQDQAIVAQTWPRSHQRCDGQSHRRVDRATSDRCLSLGRSAASSASRPDGAFGPAFIRWPLHA